MPASDQSRRQPWMKFWLADWEGNAAVQSCSWAAQGLLTRLLGIMHRAEPYGHLLVAGSRLTPAQIAWEVKGDVEEVKALLTELRDKGVLARTDDGVPFFPPMVERHRASELGRMYGQRGGNPNVVQKAAKTPTKRRKINGLHGGLTPTLNPPPLTPSVQQAAENPGKSIEIKPLTGGLTLTLNPPSISSTTSYTTFEDTPEAKASGAAGRPQDDASLTDVSNEGLPLGSNVLMLRPNTRPDPSAAMHATQPLAEVIQPPQPFGGEPDGAAKALWREGLPRVMRMLKISDDKARLRIGKWLSRMKNDHAALALILFRADANPAFHSNTWIEGCVRHHIERVNGASAPVSKNIHDQNRLDAMKDMLDQSGVTIDEVAAGLGMDLSDWDLPSLRNG